jgi:hypothetical protein
MLGSCHDLQEEDVVMYFPSRTIYLMSASLVRILGREDREHSYYQKDGNHAK